MNEFKKEMAAARQAASDMPVKEKGDEAIKAGILMGLSLFEGLYDQLVRIAGSLEAIEKNTKPKAPKIVPRPDSEHYPF